MKTLFILVGVGIFVWILKVISDGLVDKIPKSWGIEHANAKPEDNKTGGDPWDEWENSPEFSCMADNVWHIFDNDDDN